MIRLRLLRLLFVPIAALLVAAGPGSPICAATAAPHAEASTMAGCDTPGPAKRTPLPAHPDCASPCIGIVGPAPRLAPIQPADDVRPDTAMPKLDGIYPVPEAEPPRL